MPSKKAPDGSSIAPYTQVLTPRVDKAKDEWMTLKVEEQNAKESLCTSPSKEKKKRENPPALPFMALYRYAAPLDKLCLVIGILAAGANGALHPCMALAFGDAISAFSGRDVDLDAVNSAALTYLCIAIGLFATDYVSYVLFIFTAERQMKALRNAALRHMLYMDVGWYDTHDARQLSSRLTGDTVKIKDGMGNKLGEVFKFMCQFLAGYIIGFSKGWEMTLVMSCVMPVMALSFSWLIKTLRSTAQFSQKLYAEAGSVAEETLSSIRTVVSLNGEKRAIEKYNQKARVAEAENIGLARSSSLIFGLFVGSSWVMYSVGLWYGGSRVSDGKTTSGAVFQSFFAVLIGTMSLAQITPNIAAVAQARGAAAAMFEILDTPSAIDASKDNGYIPESCVGRLQAVDLHFAYPSRPDAQVLKGYNVTMEPGQTVAFVGSSGCGKSTLVALMERYYNPQSGRILLDGRDISTLNVEWLRSQIGMVSQEPVLFARTIYENIAAGGENITREQAIEAAKLANAHRFIMALPQQYDTLVGEKGVSLSGGQKQRMAIARAVVRNPKILVLDEATSALDAESERAVQNALNDLMCQMTMTTLVIAHRLSTIRHADKIVVVCGGCVVEEGTHSELLLVEDGVYKNLYTVQEEKAKEEAEAAVTPSTDSVALAPTTQTQRKLSIQSSESGHVAVRDEVSDEAPKPTFTITDAVRFSSPERKFFIIGACATMICGIATPASAVLISSLVNSMTIKYGKYDQTSDHSYLDDLSDDVTLYGAFYLGGALLMALFTATYTYCFRFMAEKLITRLRDIHFTALCRQNIGFFDEKAHSTGALAADLSTNANKVSTISGDTLGRVVQSVFTFIAALAISFATGSWLLTLVMLAVFPLLMLGQTVRRKQLRGFGGLSDELAEVGAHASEGLSNIRTIVSLGLEATWINQFEALLVLPMKKGQKEAQVNGVAVGFSSFIVIATYSLVFWYGGRLVNKGDIDFQQLMRTLMAIMMSAQGVSSAATFFAESEKATKAGAAIAVLRDRPLPIDSFDAGGERPATVEGKLEFKGITFRYPSRPGVTVLKRFDLTIEAGQTVALCGPSGGGKSTCVSMIERFYDPVEGQVLLDGRDLKTLNIQWLRSQVGLVSQEPTLFIGSISENFAYGLDFVPSNEEIEVAAKMANAHDFIMHFPDGYDTQVGMKGEQLSGGQKQRIAIARAILKNPNILLLDEATSALDTESEKIVQDALDYVVALKRRTTIIVAHRLSTIRNSDKICVVSGGQIAEQGTHQELLATGGIYTRLIDSATL